MTIIDNSLGFQLEEGISISTTNVLLNKLPAFVTDPSVDPEENLAYITDPDHSLNYTCGNTVADFALNYGFVADITYVAISGHTAATPAQATVQLFNGTDLIGSVVLKRNHNVMFTFELQTFNDLIIRFVTVPNNFQMTVSYIAAGEHLTLTHGTQAGYKRNWLTRHTTQRTTTNLQVGPVSTTQRSKSMTGSLKLPHELAEFAEGLWQDFMDFSYDQPFFLKEVSTRPESTYICFDPKFDDATHSQTRTLNALTLKFTLFNGM